MIRCFSRSARSTPSKGGNLALLTQQADRNDSNLDTQESITTPAMATLSKTGPSLKTGQSSNVFPIHQPHSRKPTDDVPDLPSSYRAPPANLRLERGISASFAIHLQAHADSRS